MLLDTKAMFHFLIFIIMLQSTLIGYLGADAVVKNINGKEFTTMRIANTTKWTDDAGNVHEETIWIDCNLNGTPAVNEYLKKGQLVMVQGTTSLRVYSSAKDRCMKAGMTIHVRNIELLGSRTDDVPSVLYKEEGGEEVKLRKFYHCAQVVREANEPESVYLVSRNGTRYRADRSGWVYSEEVDPINQPK